MPSYKKLLCIGPGGRRCVCCFPAPGSKDRKAAYRAAKRKAAKLALKQAQKDFENGND